MEIILIGTIHLDCKASGSLEQLLRKLCAEREIGSITVEISRFSLWYRTFFYQYWIRRLERTLLYLDRVGRHPVRDHPQVRLIRRQISMPFEWRTASAVAGDVDLPCVPVDSGVVARRELPCWHDQLLSARNISCLLESSDFLDMGEIFQQQYARARRFLRGGREKSPYDFASLSVLQGEAWQERERLMARRIRRMASRHGRVVHVGGWHHLIKDFYNHHGERLLSCHAEEICRQDPVTLASILEDSLYAIYLVTSQGVERIGSHYKP